MFLLLKPIFSMKFLFSKVAPYFFKSTIQSSLEYCCHVWAGLPNCYLDMFDKLQKQFHGIFGPLFAVSLLTLG